MGTPIAHTLQLERVHKHFWALLRLMHWFAVSRVPQNTHLVIAALTFGARDPAAVPLGWPWTMELSSLAPASAVSGPLI